MSNKSAAQETIAELDSMESNLRRLGLGTDTAVDPVQGHSDEATEAYMARIRTTKDERRKLKHEKTLRQFMINAKESDNEKYFSRVAEAKRVQTIVDGAPDLLKEENKRAGEVVKARAGQDAETAQRAVQLRKGQQLQQELLVERSKADSLHRHPLPSASDCRPESLETFSGGAGSSVKSALLTTLQQDDAIEFCETLAYGMVDLSVLVSDNRHLPEPDVSGEPVHRLIQDLGVTQWSQWVQQCLGGAASSMDEDRTDGVASSRTVGSPSSPARGAGVDPEEALRQQLLTERRDLAREHVAVVSQQDAVRTNEVGQTAVLEALAAFLQENERVHKAACEAIRRDYTEEDYIVDGQAHTAMPVPAASGRAMEEVVPRWAQRMPPAATFLNGDDLSGARLLAEKIEQAARRGMTTTTTHTSGGAAEDAPSAATAAKSGKKSSVPPTPVGVMARDGGLKKIFMTPRTLTGQLSVTPGARAQLGSAGRGRTAGKGGSNGAGARRVSNLNGDDEERREMEVLSDLLVRELLSLHTHNVHVLTSGKMPLPPSMAGLDTLASGAFSSSTMSANKQASGPSAGAAAATGIPTTTSVPKARSSSRATTPPLRAASPTASTTTATASMPAAPPSEPLPLQTMVLVGFPESEIFYRLVCDKLRAQMDAVELEMLTEERRLANVVADGALAAANSSPAGKSKAPHPPPRAKSAKSVNNKGSSSNLSAQRQLSETSDTLLRSKVFPPLCILGFFLEYSLSTRHLRLRDAAVRCGGSDNTSSSPASTPAAAPALDPLAMSLFSAAAAAAGVDPLSGTTSPALSHPVFAPAPPLHAPSLTSPRVTSASGSGIHVNRERPSTTHLSLSSSAALPAHGVPTTSAVPPVGELWSTAQVQRELVEQDRRMHRWQEAWCGCFARVSASNFRKAAALVVKQVRRRSGDKSGAAAALPSPRKPSHSTGFSAGNNNNAMGLEGGAGSAAVVLPKVLFFFRKEDVSDMDHHAEQIATELAEQEAWLWLAQAPTSPEGGSDATTGAAIGAVQTRWAAFLMSRLLDCFQGSARVITNEALAPQQLPPPLRLGDYRLPRDALSRLVTTYEYHTRHPLVAFTTANGADAGKLAGPMGLASPHDSTVMPLALAAEMDLMRVFSMHLAQTLELLRAGVFGHALWEQQALMSTVAQYTSIDDDHAAAKSALQDQGDSTRRRLYARAVVLLRLAIDAALEATVDALAQLSATLLTHCFVSPSSPLQPLECSSSLLSSRPGSGGGARPAAGEVPSPSDATYLAARAALLAQLRRLTEGEVEAMVSPYFVQESTAEATAAMGAALEPYAKELQQSATAYLVDTLRRAEDTYALEEGTGGGSGSQRSDGAEAAATGPLTASARPRLVWATLVPSLVARVLARTFCVPEVAATLPEVGRSIGRSTAPVTAPTGTTHVPVMTPPAPLPMTGIAAPLVRTVGLVQTVVGCLDLVGTSSSAWLGMMYHLALHVPAGSSYPPVCRPPSVAALLCPPSLAAATRGDEDMRAWSVTVQKVAQAIAHAEETSLVWQRCRLELFLADMSLYNASLLTEDAFVHCAALHQLRDLCWYTACDARALATAVGFSFNEAAEPLGADEAACWNDLVARHADLFMGFTLAGDERPRAPNSPATIAQLRAAFAQHAERVSASEAGETPISALSSSSLAPWKATVDVRQWCCDVIRCSAFAEAHEPLVGGARQAVSLARPSSRELRAAVLTLPYAVVVQAMLASAATDRGEAYMTSAAPSALVPATALDARAWCETTQWWPDLAPRQHAAVRWSLLRALTARYMLTASAGVPSTPAPRLPTVLHWLARTSCGASPQTAPASYFEAIYHCLAALQYRLQVEAQAVPAKGQASPASPDSVAACIDPHAVAPLAADDVVVRAADFGYYLGGGAGSAGAGVPLGVEALLLAQSAGDGVVGVPLPLLLSSQWGRTLVQRHTGHESRPITTSALAE